LLIGHFTIPDRVRSISDAAFHGCTGLTSVTIPNSVTSIAESAFWGCPISNALLSTATTTIKSVIYDAHAIFRIMNNSINLCTQAAGLIPRLLVKMNRTSNTIPVNLTKSNLVFNSKMTRERILAYLICIRRFCTKDKIDSVLQEAQANHILAKTFNVKKTISQIFCIDREKYTLTPDNTASRTWFLS
jgi:hypothetical protein